MAACEYILSAKRLAPGFICGESQAVSCLVHIFYDITYIEIGMYNFYKEWCLWIIITREIAGQQLSVGDLRDVCDCAGTGGTYGSGETSWGAGCTG